MKNKVMGKIPAIIYILNKLEQGTVTTKSLAEDLQVSTKSIQRYIRDIETAEFPLYCPSKGEYSFTEGFSLKKMELSGSEAGLLILMKKFINSLNNSNLNKTFNSFKNKILNNGNTDNPFYIKFAGGTEYKTTDITKKIEDAVKNKEYITISYRNKNNLLHKLKPLKIANYEGFWYLICLGTADKILKFNIDNIVSVKKLNKFFEKTKNINTVLKESTTIWFEAERNITVNLQIDKQITKYFKNKKYFPLQKILKINKDNSAVLECKISKEEEIIPTIMHWIPFIKVISPESLDIKIKQLIKEYLK